MRIRHNRKQHSLPAILKIVNTKLLHYAQYLNMPSRTLQYNYHFYATCIWQSLEQCSLFTLKSIKFNFYVLKISNTIFIKKLKSPHHDGFIINIHKPWQRYLILLNFQSQIPINSIMFAFMLESWLSAVYKEQLN